MSDTTTGFRVAVVGATGLVGEAMLECLARRGFPVSEIVLLASERSAGTQLEFAGRKMPVRELAAFDFSGIDIALFSAGGSVSKEHAPGPPRQAPSSSTIRRASATTTTCPSSSPR
jgi:aspartate-semialdehyde dehydrogenase